MRFQTIQEFQKVSKEHQEEMTPQSTKTTKIKFANLSLRTFTELTFLQLLIQINFFFTN